MPYLFLKTIITKRKKIVVADDDSAILEATCLILKDAGYRVVTVSNDDTFDTVKTEKPDLLLLDIWMSGVDGRDICKNLKMNEATKNIPIILISANKDTEEIAKEVGANDFIAKPFDMNDLINKIEKHTNS